MPEFRELSFADRWRVRRFVFRGEAPEDARMAAAAVELAENYQRQGYMRWLRWGTPVVVLGALFVAILDATDGDLLGAILFALLAVVNLSHLALNPATRPKSVARSLEASRQVLAADG